MSARKVPKIEPLVVKAIRRLQDVKGSTAREINDYINRRYEMSGSEMKKQIQLALKRAVSYGILKNKSGHYVYNDDLFLDEPKDMENVVERKRRGRRRTMRRGKRAGRRRSGRRRRSSRRRRGRRSGRRRRGRRRSMGRMRKYDDAAETRSRRPLRNSDLSRTRNGSRSGDTSGSESADGRVVERGSRHGSQHIDSPEARVD